MFLVTGDYQKAVDDFGVGLRLSPGDAAAFSRRGQAYAGLGQVQHAIDDFRASLAIDPSLVSAKEGVARLQQASVDH